MYPVYYVTILYHYASKQKIFDLHKYKHALIIYQLYLHRNILYKLQNTIDTKAFLKKLQNIRRFVCYLDIHHCDILQLPAE